MGGGGGCWSLTSPKSAHVMHQSVFKIFPQSATYFLLARGGGRSEVRRKCQFMEIFSTVILLTGEEPGQARTIVGRIACVGSDSIIWTIKK